MSSDAIVTLKADHKEIRRLFREFQAAGDKAVKTKAKLVAIAYADARDQANTGAWKAREAQDCKAAMDALHVVPPSGGSPSSFGASL